MRKTTRALVSAALFALSQQALAAATVTVAHLAPFADTIEDTQVDIAVNGEIALPGVPFKAFSDPLAFDAGEYTIDVLLAGTDTVAISGVFNLEDETEYLLFATGNGTTQDLELKALVNDATPPADDSLNIRIAHYAPFSADLDATRVDIRTGGGDLVNGLTGVPYDADSGFFEIPAANYDLKVTSVGGATNLIDILPLDLPPGVDITVFAVGDGINQPLGIIAVPVGELATRRPVDNRSNGMWEIVEGSGTGFIFQPMPSQNRAVGTWYTYTELGDPTFLTFDSCFEEDDGMGGVDCATPGGFDGVTAVTALYSSSGGGNSEEDVVETMQVGTIEFEILGCNDAMAVVTLDGGEAEMYTAKQLTRPFPCDEASFEQD